MPDYQLNGKELFKYPGWYKLLFENARDAMFIADAETGILIDANAQAEKLTKRPKQQLIGMHYIQLHSPEDEEMARQLFNKQLSECGASPVEAVVMAADGETVPVEIISNIIEMEDGKLLTQSIFHDISDRKRVEDKLQESKQMLQMVLDTIPVRVFWKDRNLNYLGCNYMFACDAGLSSPDEIIGKSDLEMPWKEQVEDYRADDRAVIETGQPKLHYEETQTTPIGDLTWIVTSKIPLKDPEGHIIGILGTYEDITERKLAIDALRASEEKFSKAFRSAPVLMAIAEMPESRFIDVNDYFCQVLGYTRDEIIGRTPLEMDLWVNLEDRSRTLACLYQGKIISNDEVKLRTKSGRVIDTLISMYLIHIAGKLCTMAIINDITDRKRAEEAVKLNEARLEALLQLSRRAQAPIQELADFALEEAVKLTKSQYGYWALVSEDESVLNMYAWSLAALQDCKIPDKPLIYSVAETGLWGEAIRQRKPIITNDYSEPSPWKKGFPEGHIPIKRHMNVPIFDDGRIVAIAGVANKEEPYDESDVRQLMLLMHGMWQIFVQRKHEETLKQLEGHKRQFYRETIRSVTDGKLDISGYEEVLPYIESAERHFEVHNALDVATVRTECKNYLVSKGLSGDDLDQLIMGVGEAITNALKHAGGGKVYCGWNTECVWVVVSDAGPGIDALVLPRATLLKGFSTKPSLGFGYSVILDVADHVLLCTGPQGTTVAIIKNLFKKGPVVSLESMPDVWDNLPS